MAIQKINTFEEYQEQYKKSVDFPEQFWDEIANTFVWKKKWDKTLEWSFTDPKIKWFLNGKLNITENCLDRHLKTQPNKTAIIWEPNNPQQPHKTFTYKELHTEVCKVASLLKSIGINKGDRVCLYMPMIPELAISVLACARIGAIHSVVFAGFSSKALADRINDSECKLLITADFSYRGDKKISLTEITSEALKNTPCIQKTLLVQTQLNNTVVDKNTIVWHEEINNHSGLHMAETMDSEDNLFILYTSGSTGKPKGVVHTTGGYMVYAEYSFRNVFQYNDEDIYWCTADVGWITGHSYIIYGPLLAGATTVMFEGIPTHPTPGRFWDVVDKHKVNIFYTAPTAIRALQACSIDYVNNHNLSSLKVLGSVGEPINEEAWEWYHKHIGKEKCPIVDTWWQTETGGILISPLANITPLKPTFATLPLPGVQPCLVDEKGEEIIGNNVEGNLCIKHPWPSMLRTTWGDHERCKNTYFSIYKNKYFTGDGCKRDKDGYYRITGRVDDVINVSGHRIGTAEVEDSINTHPNIIESAVVGFPHEIKGQGICAFVIAENNFSQETIQKEILNQVSSQIGAIAKPDKIFVVEGLPKTRSGKIMRRILRKIAENQLDNFGDTSTLLEPSVVEKIIQKLKQQ